MMETDRPEVCLLIRGSFEVVLVGSNMSLPFFTLGLFLPLSHRTWMSTSTWRMA